MPKTAVGLLVMATAVSIISLSSLLVLLPAGKIGTIFGLLPILLGGITMWLCWRARRVAHHKTAVLIYTILLAPVAFSYPAGILLLRAAGVHVEIGLH